MNIAPLITFFLTGATIGIATWEAFTNRSKLKLSLYNKRWEIFKGAHELHLILLRRKDENIDKELDEFTKKYREAKFLFSLEDGVLSLLKEFRQKAFNIAYWQDEQVNGSTYQTTEKITTHQSRMEEDLNELEKKLQPYLQAPSYSLLKDLISRLKRQSLMIECIRIRKST